jgi:hypothetical protein
MQSPLDRPDVAALLAATPYADVAVATRRGPHATPAAFAAADGRLWVVSSRRTVRVRAIRRTGMASALVRNGDRSVVVSGTASVLSPWPPSEAIALAAGALPATKAAALYTLRNLRIVLAGFAADLVTGAGDPTVYDRVLIAVDADRGMLIEGTEVLDTWGRWRHTARPAPPRSTRPAQALDDLLAGVPSVPAAALQRRDTAALGWLGPTGAVILPALGGVEEGRVQVSAAALDHVSADGRSEACITVHDSDAARPSGYRGVVLRGDGRVTRRGARRATVSLEADRVSWWSGFRAGTSWGPDGRP